MSNHADTLPEAPLCFARVQDEAELVQLESEREAMYLSRMPKSNIAWAEERLKDRARDAAGFVFALSRNGKLLAVSRALAASSPEAELTGMNRMPDEFQRDPQAFEIGRIASDPSSNSRPGYGMLIAACTAIWFLGELPESRYIAYCKPRVARYWQNVGAAQVGETFGIEGRAKQYMIIAGRADAVKRSALDAGWLSPGSVAALSSAQRRPALLETFAR